LGNWIIGVIELLDWCVIQTINGQSITRSPDHQITKFPRSLVRFWFGTWCAPVRFLRVLGPRRRVVFRDFHELTVLDADASQIDVAGAFLFGFLHQFVRVLDQCR
jgi:hypothetical protein